MHVYGHGVPQDLRAARAQFERAASAGDAYGYYNLGALRMGGIGVAADAARAASHFEVTPQQRQ